MEKHKLVYHGPADGAFDLVSELREAGHEPAWTPPDAARGSFLEEVVVAIFATGTVEALKAITGKVVSRIKASKVDVDPDDEPAE